MELQIQHLAPYLPYKLYFRMTDGIKLPMNGLKENVIFVKDGYSTTIHYKGARPLLKSLKILDSDDIIRLGLFVEADKQYLINFPLNCCYEDFQYLLSKHYDVFGLIEAGLAEEIL